jgi:hypothetical protein
MIDRKQATEPNPAMTPGFSLAMTLELKLDAHTDTHTPCAEVPGKPRYRAAPCVLSSSD